MYEDARRADTNIYAQKIGGESDGYTVMSYRDMFAKWTFNSPASNHKMVTDSSGNVYVAWQETRPTVMDPHAKIYLQKFDSTGVPLWTNNGYLVSNPSYEATDPDLAITGSSGIYVVFLQNGDIIVKKYTDTTGAISTVTIQHGNDTFTEPKVVDDDGGNAIVAYIKNGSEVDLYVNGTPNPINGCSTPSGLILKKDRMGGCYALFKNKSDECLLSGWSDALSTVYTERYLNPPGAGDIEKYDFAVDIFTDANIHYEAFVALSAVNDTTNRPDIWFMPYSNDGTGITIVKINWLNLTENQSNYSYSPKVTVDALQNPGDHGGAVVVWHTIYGALSHKMVETQGYTKDTVRRWAKPIIVSSGNFDSEKPVIDRVSTDYSMVVWEDSRATGRNNSPKITLYAHRIYPRGTDSASVLLWPSDGRVLSEPAGGSETKPIVLNSFDDKITAKGSATIFWQDERSDTACIVGTRKIPDSDGTLAKPVVHHLVEHVVPSDVKLFQNYPNPFGRGSSSGTTATTIQFHVPEEASVSLSVFDLFGREVLQLFDRRVPQGEYVVRLNSDNLPSGIYFYRLAANQQTTTRKMIVLR